MKISIRNVSGLVFLFLAVLLCCLRANAASTSITGTVRGPDNSAFYGSVVFQLPVPVQNISNNTSICPCAVQYRINNGIVATYNGLAPTLLDNDNMQPAGTFYIASFYDMSGNFKWQANYVIPAGATWDIGQAVPTSVTTTNISYINPMTTNTAQNITGTKTFTVPWISTVATGTAPFAVASQTKVTGLKAASITSDSANPATTATAAPILLANADKVCWRNGTNANDNCLMGNTNTGAAAGLQYLQGNVIFPLSLGFQTSYSTTSITVSNSTNESLAVQPIAGFTSTTSPDVTTIRNITIFTSGNLTNTSGGAVNYTFRIREFGLVGTILATTPATSIPTATTNAPWNITIWLTCITNCGTSTAVWDVSGSYWLNTTSGALTSAGTIAFDPTTGNGVTVAVTGQMGTANATATFIGRVETVVRVQ